MEGNTKSVSNGGYENGNSIPNGSVANKRRIGSCETLLRLLVTGLTLSAAVIMGVDNQTKVIAVKVLDSLPPMNVPATAKWHYLSSFTFFVVANAVACAYAAISLVVCLGIRGGKKSGIFLTVFIFDVIMVALLFSSIGAAGGIGLMGYEGNPRVQWKKVCDNFGRFCNQGMIALLISLTGSTALVLLIALSATRLHHKK